MTPRPVRLLFVSSVWLLVAWSAYRMVETVLHYQDIMSIVPGREAARYFISPFAIFLSMLFFWFRFFRDERDGARVMATLIGCFMIIQIIILSFWRGLFDWYLPAWGMVICAYVMVGHFAYAFAGRESRHRSHGRWW